MSIEFNGKLEYIMEGQDETITHDTTNIRRNVNLEEYSKAQSKDDTTEYRTVDELITDEGTLKWETITRVSMDGTSSETELIEQPKNIEVIQDFDLKEDESE